MSGFIGVTPEDFERLRDHFTAAQCNHMRTMLETLGPTLAGKDWPFVEVAAKSFETGMEAREAIYAASLAHKLISAQGPLSLFMAQHGAALRKAFPDDLADFDTAMTDTVRLMIAMSLALLRIAEKKLSN